MQTRDNELDRFAAQGREGDSLMGHLTPGDLVIPMEIQTPEIVNALRKHFAANGVPMERFLAGHKANSKNPSTGAPEFLGNWITHPLKTAEKAISNPVKTLEHYVTDAA